MRMKAWKESVEFEVVKTPEICATCADCFSERLFNRKLVGCQKANAETDSSVRGRVQLTGTCEAWMPA